MMIGQQQKDQAENWFKNLRDKICEEFEILEEDHLKLAPKSDVAAKNLREKAQKEKQTTKKTAVGASWQRLKVVEYLRK